jgi:hypothetical protein
LAQEHAKRSEASIAAVNGLPTLPPFGRQADPLKLMEAWATVTKPSRNAREPGTTLFPRGKSPISTLRLRRIRRPTARGGARSSTRAGE